MKTGIFALPLRIYHLASDPSHQPARDEFYAGGPGKRLLRHPDPVGVREVEEMARSEPVIVWDDDNYPLMLCKFATNHEALSLMRDGWELIET